MLAFANLFQENADDPVGGFVFQIFGLALCEGLGIDAQEELRGRPGILFPDAKGFKTGKDAGDHPRDFPGCRGQDAFVEIVEVEIYQPVLTLVAAEVFEMQVTADPTERISRKSIAGVEVFVEEVAGTPEKPEWVFCHRLIFERGICW